MIVVFGSLSVDLHFSMTQMPRPGETHLCQTYEVIPGGKGGNQAVAAAHAGSKVIMQGAIGDDDFGRLLRASLIEAGVDCSGVWVVGTPTGCSSICVDRSGESMITVAQGANVEAKESDVADSLLTPSTTILVQMETVTTENWKLIERAKAKGCRTIVNLAPATIIPNEITSSIDILVLNETAARFLARHLFFPYLPLEEMAPYVAKNLNLTVVISQGKHGAVAATPENTWQIPAMTITPVDTTAAGDALVGVLAASLDQGHTFESSLRRATIASGLACLKKGGQSSLPTLQEIENALHKLDKIRLIA